MRLNENKNEKGEIKIMIKIEIKQK